MRRIENVYNKYTQGMPNGIVIPEKAKPYLLAFGEDYAKTILALHKVALRKQQRSLFFMLMGDFAKLTWDQFLDRILLKNLKRHKATAQRFANENRRKYYVIQSSRTNYLRFSSRDVKKNKNLHVFKSMVTAKELSETADFIALPKK